MEEAFHSLGGYGAREASFVIFFGCFDVGLESALAFGLLNLICYWTLTLIGAYLFIFRGGAPVTGKRERETCMKKIKIEKSESCEIVFCPYGWLSVVQIIVAMGILIFWGYFFAVEHSNPLNTDIFLAYERSFPLPDILWIAALLLLSAFWLKKGNRKGIVSTIAAGGALVFLGLVDFSFNLQQGMYTKGLFNAMFNVFVNLSTLGFGLTSVIAGGKLLDSMKQ